MNSSSPKRFYLFKGDWYERFIELIDIVQIDRQQRFAILEPRDKKKDHNMIILFNTSLSDSYCFSKKIWKTDEEVFRSFYKPKIKRFNIHTNYYSGDETDGSALLNAEHSLDN